MQVMALVSCKALWEMPGCPIACTCMLQVAEQGEMYTPLVLEKVPCCVRLLATSMAPVDMGAWALLCPAHAVTMK